MVHRTGRTNVASGLLVLTAIAFTLTASAYAVMAVKRLDADGGATGAEASSGLIEFLDRHGAGLMFAELVFLAVAAVAAIGTERWQTGRRDVPPDTRPAENQVQRESQECVDESESLRARAVGTGADGRGRGLPRPLADR